MDLEITFPHSSAKLCDRIPWVFFHLKYIRTAIIDIIPTMLRVNSTPSNTDDFLDTPETKIKIID